MASKETPVSEAEKVVAPPPHETLAAEPKKAELPREATAVEPEKAEPSSEVKTQAAAPPVDYFALADVVLRFLLFASAVVAVVVMVTSKQTERVPLPFFPFLSPPMSAKFNHSPAFIYFVAAFSVAGLYSIITTLLSFYALLKPGRRPTVLSHFVIFDVLLLGIEAAATGAAGAVGYIGLKGNSHVRWQKVCKLYDEFCRHIGASIFVALFGSIVLVLLVLLSVYSLSKRIPK